MNTQTMQDPYNLSIADVAQAGISDLTIAKIITQTNQNVQQNSVSGEDLSAGLLAALLKRTAPKNVKYNIYPFSLAGSLYQQVIPENKARIALAISYNYDTEGGTSPGILLQEGPIAVTSYGNDISARTFFFNNVASGSMTIRTFEFLHTPINAVCIVSSLGTSTTSGVIIEGVIP